MRAAYDSLVVGRTKYLGPRLGADATDKQLRRMFRKHEGKKFYYQMSKGHELDKRQLRGYRRRHQRRMRRWYEEHGARRDSRQ